MDDAEEALLACGAGHSQHLRYGKAGGEVGRNALEVRCRTTSTPSILAGTLIITLGCKAVNSSVPPVHGFFLAEKPRIQLPGNPTETAAGSLIHRAKRFRALLDDQLVSLPEQFPRSDAGIRLTISSMRAFQNLGSDLTASRESGGLVVQPADDALGRIGGIEQAPQLGFQFGLAPFRSRIDHPGDPRVEDQRGTIPPDLHIRIGLDQSFDDTFGHLSTPIEPPRRGRISRLSKIAPAWRRR